MDIKKDKINPTNPEEESEQPVDEVLNIAPDEPKDGDADSADKITEEPEATAPVANPDLVVPPDHHFEDKPAVGEEKPKKRFNKKILLWIPLVLAVALVLAGLLSSSVRFMAFNLIGDGKLEVSVIDSSTRKPIKDATVSAAGLSGKTDDNGQVALEGVAYGHTDLMITKEAYATHDHHVTVNWGQNKVGLVELKPEGIPVNVSAANIITDESITGFSVKIADSEISASSGDDGVATLNVPPPSDREVELVITANDYNDATTKVKVTRNAAVNVKLAPTGRHYFLSNRTGNIDVYSANLDGSDVKKLIAGTGQENEFDVEFSLAPSGTTAILIAKRDALGAGKLYQVDLGNGGLTVRDEGGNGFNFRGWSGKYAIYEADLNKSEDKIKVLDTDTGLLSTLVTDNESYFHSVIGDYVIYEKYDKSWRTYAINIATKKTITLTGTGYYQIYRTAPDTGVYQVGNTWYQFKDGAVTKLSAKPNNLKGREFTAANSKGQLAWRESRDGRGVIVIGDGNAVGGTVVEAGQNVDLVHRWVGDEYLIFSVATSDESADYIVHVESGKTKKISNVYRSYYGY